MAASGCKTGIFRIQPSYQDRDQWTALARGEKLCFEPLELFIGPKPSEEKVAWYQNSGLVTALHGAFIDINPASGDLALRELSRRRCHESCAMAKKLGAEQVIFHGSCFPFLRSGYLKFWADTCAAFYTDLAEEYALTICIENSMDVDPTPLVELFKRTDHTGVKACLDIGHANYSRVGLDAWFDALSNRIACMHLSDNMGDFDEHLRLGSGTVDWSLVDRNWRFLGAEIPLTLEVGGISGVQDALTYLKGRGFFGLGE